MRVLVCGSRTWTDVDAVEAVLDGLDKRVKHDFLTLIEGGANGADCIASQWATDRENPGWVNRILLWPSRSIRLHAARGT